MRRDYIVGVVEAVVGKRAIAEAVVARLESEGLLNVFFGDQDISLICETFKEQFGTTKISRYDRYAAGRLAKRYGGEQIAGIIKLMASRASEPYAPTVGSVTQLEEKLVNVMKFLKGQAVQEIEL